MAFKIADNYFDKLALSLKANHNDKLFVLGVDESYANTGLSISYGNPFDEYETIDCINLNNAFLKGKNEYRVLLYETICKFIEKHKSELHGCIECVTVVERIRQFSKGFISMDYIKSMGALIAYIVEASSQYFMPTFSVDTRCWKSTVVGNSKPMLNSYHVAPEKYPTVEYALKYGMKEFIFEEVSEKAGMKELKKKNPHNVFKSATGKYIHVDDDKADSICISRFIFEAMLKGKEVDKLLKFES